MPIHAEDEWYAPEVGADEGADAEATLAAHRQPGRCEHFIPLRKSELIAWLLRDERLSVTSRQEFQALCRRIEAAFHEQFRARLESLKTAYVPFDPDEDTQRIEPLPAADRDAQCPQLFDKFIELLELANFSRLSHDDLQEAIAAASQWGVRLHVDFGIFERLEVFGRGDVISRRTGRSWRHWYRREEFDVPIFQRLVVIFRLCPHKRLVPLDVGPVFIKIFKNIPKQDMDMLLPGTRVRMSLVDQGKIWIPTATGIGLSVFKVVKSALWLLWFGTLAGMLAFAGFLAGLGGFAIKSLIGYLRTKDKYHLNLTRSLYYQNLDNNAGVLFRLLDEAEEQEVRESILAYFVLWIEGTAAGWTTAQLDRRVEEFLKASVDLDVDFEAEDALRKLQKLGLVESLGTDVWRAVPPVQALQKPPSCGQATPGPHS